jgi:hypothetical protein
MKPTPDDLPTGVRFSIGGGAGKTGPMSGDVERAVFVRSLLSRFVVAAILAFSRFVFTKTFVDVVTINPLDLPRWKLVEVLNTSGRDGVMTSTLWACPLAVLRRGAA